MPAEFDKDAQFRGLVILCVIYLAYTLAGGHIEPKINTPLIIINFKHKHADQVLTTFFWIILSYFYWSFLITRRNSIFRDIRLSIFDIAREYLVIRILILFGALETNKLLYKSVLVTTPRDKEYYSRRPYEFWNSFRFETDKNEFVGWNPERFKLIMSVIGFFYATNVHRKIIGHTLFALCILADIYSSYLK